MNRTQYQEARRLIRDNGRAAYRWLADTLNAERLRDLSDQQDLLAERLQVVDYCKRQGLAYTFHHLRLTRPLWSGLRDSTACR